MSEVVEFPTPAKLVESLFGPVSRSSALIVDGRVIPKIQVRRSGERIAFILDGRMLFEFSEEYAHQAAAFAANAMAIGAGYPFLGSETKECPFAPQGMEIIAENGGGP